MKYDVIFINISHRSYDYFSRDSLTSIDFSAEDWRWIYDIGDLRMIVKRTDINTVIFVGDHQEWDKFYNTVRAW